MVRCGCVIHQSDIQYDKIGSVHSGKRVMVHNDSHKARVAMVAALPNAKLCEVTGP